MEKAFPIPVKEPFPLLFDLLTPEDVMRLVATLGGQRITIPKPDDFLEGLRQDLIVYSNRVLNMSVVDLSDTFHLPYHKIRNILKKYETSTYPYLAFTLRYGDLVQKYLGIEIPDEIVHYLDLVNIIELENTIKYYEQKEEEARRNAIKAKRRRLFYNYLKRKEMAIRYAQKSG